MKFSGQFFRLTSLTPVVAFGISRSDHISTNR